MTYHNHLDVEESESFAIKLVEHFLCFDSRHLNELILLRCEVKLASAVRIIMKSSVYYRRCARICFNNRQAHALILGGWSGWSYFPSKLIFIFRI